MTVPLFTNWLTNQPMPLGLGFVSVKDYGAIGDAATDDTAALQAAINAATSAAGGFALYLNPGTYKITSTLTVSTNGLFLFGAGTNNSVISAPVGISAFTITAIPPCVFKNFSVNYPSISNNGTAAFLVTQATANSPDSLYEGLTINNAFTGMQFNCTGNGNIARCNVNACSFIGCVFGCTFNNTGNFYTQSNINFTNNFVNNAIGAAAFSAGFQILGGSAFRINGNFFLNSGANNTYGVYVNFSVGLPSSNSDLFISNNSFEALQYGIVLSRQGTTGAFSNTQIVGNEFLCNSDGIFNTVDATGPWMYGLVITDNVMFCPTTGTFNGININAANDFVIANNLVYTGPGSSGTYTAILVASACTNGSVLQNATAASSSSIVNLTNGSTTAVLDDMNGLTFANLPAAAKNGSRLFVTDGTSPSSPLTGGGTGTTAFRQNGAWKGI